MPLSQAKPLANPAATPTPTITPTSPPSGRSRCTERVDRNLLRASIRALQPLFRVLRLAFQEHSSGHGAWSGPRAPLPAPCHRPHGPRFRDGDLRGTRLQVRTQRQDLGEHVVGHRRIRQMGRRGRAGEVMQRGPAAPELPEVGADVADGLGRRGSAAGRPVGLRAHRTGVGVRAVRARTRRTRTCTRHGRGTVGAPARGTAHRPSLVSAVRWPQTGQP